MAWQKWPAEALYCHLQLIIGGETCAISMTNFALLTLRAVRSREPDQRVREQLTTRIEAIQKGPCNIVQASYPPASETGPGKHTPYS